jgi:hypothetical protein
MQLDIMTLFFFLNLCRKEEDEPEATEKQIDQDTPIAETDDQVEGVMKEDQTVEQEEDDSDDVCYAKFKLLSRV